MKQELQNKLFKEFPLLYRDVNKPMTQTCMCWGIETGDGWFDLIYDLSKELEVLITAMKTPEADPEWLPAASQVKEKFGTLRYYMTNSTNEMEDLISKAEGISSRTCEECGKAGQSNNGGWLSVRCRDHWDSLQDYDEATKEHEEWLKKSREEGGCF